MRAVINTVDEAKNNAVCEAAANKIMGKGNFIGSEQVKKLGLFSVSNVPAIPFSLESIEEHKHNYLMILGVNAFSDGKPVTIRNLINHFGKNPDVSEPCFYNQDWYDSEDFIDMPMINSWYFIRKTVYEDSRAVQPTELMYLYSFPYAICCTYSFFVAWLTLGVKLWYHDFVWCRDLDHNRDRIYVGKYNDVDGVNKNGFSIHRHLSLRQCYGCID